MEKLINWLFYNPSKPSHITIKQTKLFTYFVRFKVLPFILSPILYPYIHIKIHNGIGMINKAFNSSSEISEWMNKNGFKFDNNIKSWFKTSHLYNNNPKYYNSVEQNEIEIKEEFYKAFRHVLRNNDVNHLNKYLFFKSNVTIHYATRSELLETMDGDEYNETLETLAKINKVSSEEMIKRLVNDNQKLKFIVYSVYISYIYLELTRRYSISFMLMLICVILIGVMGYIGLN